jgi:hypothetical protein
MRPSTGFVLVVGVACSSDPDSASKQDVAALQQRVTAVTEGLERLRSQVDALERRQPGAGAVTSGATKAAEPTNPTNVNEKGEPAARTAKTTSGVGWWCFSNSQLCWKTEEECRFAERSDVYVRRDPSKDGVVLFDHQQSTYQWIKWDDIRPALGSGRYSFDEARTPEITRPPFKGECSNERGAACLEFVRVLDRSKHRDCYRSMTTCQERRSTLLRGSAADIEITVPCGPG